MPIKDKKTIELPFQGRVDGTVEAFEINGNLTIPSEEGVTYVSWQNVVDFFPQAREKDYPVPTHFLVLDQHGDVRYGIPVDYKNGPLRENARQMCLQWIQEAQDSAVHNSDSFTLRAAGAFSSRMESLQSPEQVGLSEQAVRTAVSILRHELAGLDRDRRAQVESVLNFLAGKGPDVPVPVPDAPEGATHYQPNPSETVNGLFYRFQDEGWQYWYGGEWCETRKGLTPPHLIPIVE